MNIEELIELIQVIGFPIATAIICYWYINKTHVQMREDNLLREERLHNQQDKLANILSDATQTIDRMNIRLDVIEHKIDNLSNN